MPHTGASRWDYRRACARLYEQFDQSDDPEIANFVVWTCTLAPDAVDDCQRAIAMANKAVQAQPESDQFLNTLGAILFRAGRHEEAVKRITELDRWLENPDHTAQTSPAYTWYFLAMAHKKAGNEEQAKEYLNKATKWADDVLDDKEHPPAWNRRATLEILREEAETLVGTDE